MDLGAIFSAGWASRGSGTPDFKGFPPPASLPRGRRFELPSGDITYYREVRGPESAPTILLLHGWMATAGLNWLQTFEPLSRSFRVIAPDLRGHGRGLRSWKPFRLQDCADDAADLLRGLGTGPVIAVGYSMGGAVAQLLWKKYPELVSGLVLCATGPSFLPAVPSRIALSTALGALAGTTRLAQASTYVPRQLWKTLFPDAAPSAPKGAPAWAWSELREHDLRMVLEAGVEIGLHSAWSWLPEIDVPTAVLVTTRDAAILPTVQLEMARAISGATIHRVQDGHIACASPDFGETLSRACLGLYSMEIAA